MGSSRRHTLAAGLFHGKPTGFDGFGDLLTVAPRCSSFAAPSQPPLDAEEDFDGVFALPSGHCDELIE